MRGLAFGRLAGTAAAVSCLGPLVGGLVEGAFGWRAVMALPVLGVLVIPFLWRALTDEGSGASLDILGAVLVAGTAAGMVLLVQSPSTGLLVALVGIGLMVFGAPAVALQVRRRPHGFLPVTVIRNPLVVRSAVAAAAVPASWFAMLIAMPAVLLSHGWEAWQVGLAMVPSALVALAVPRVAGPLLTRIGSARSLVVAALVASVALAIAALGAHLVSAPVLMVAIVLVTFAFGVGQPALSAAVGDAVEPDVRGVALGVSTLLFLVGGSVGSAVVAGLSGVLGLGGALAFLAVLPLLGLLVLRPTLRAEALAARRLTVARSAVGLASAPPLGIVLQGAGPLGACRTLEESDVHAHCRPHARSPRRQAVPDDPEVDGDLGRGRPGRRRLLVGPGPRPR